MQTLSYNWTDNESHCLLRESCMSQWSGEDTQNHMGSFSFQFLKFTCCVTLNRSSSCCFSWIKWGWWFFHLEKMLWNQRTLKKCGIYLRNQRWTVVPRKGTAEVGLHFSFSLTLVTLYNRVLRTSLLLFPRFWPLLSLLLPQTYFWSFGNRSGIPSLFKIKTRNLQNSLVSPFSKCTQ